MTPDHPKGRANSVYTIREEALLRGARMLYVQSNATRRLDASIERDIERRALHTGPDDGPRRASDGGRPSLHLGGRRLARSAHSRGAFASEPARGRRAHVRRRDQRRAPSRPELARPVHRLRSPRLDTRLAIEVGTYSGVRFANEARASSRFTRFPRPSTHRHSRPSRRVRGASHRGGEQIRMRVEARSAQRPRASDRPRTWRRARPRRAKSLPSPPLLIDRTACARVCRFSTSLRHCQESSTACIVSA